MKATRRRFFGFVAATPLAMQMPLSAPVVEMVAADIAPVALSPIGTGSFITSDIILKEALHHLENNLVLSHIARRDFGGPGKISVRQPQRFRPYSPSDNAERAAS